MNNYVKIVGSVVNKPKYEVLVSSNGRLWILVYTGTLTQCGVLRETYITLGYINYNEEEE